MKIGIFTNNYLPIVFGVPGSVESFRKELEKKGHEVYIFAPKWKGYRDNNPRVIRFSSLDIKIKIRFPLAIPFSFRAFQRIREIDLDIIHSQHPNLLGWTAMQWAKRKKIPLVFTWHTLYDKYAHFVPFIPWKLTAWWTIRNARIYANKSDIVIAPTESIIPTLKNWGVKSQIVPILTGVSEEEFQDSNGEKIREKFGISDKNIVLLLVSRLTKEKNIDFLFKSLRKALEKNARVKFLVVGGGNLLESLKAWAKREKLNKKIIFAGLVERGEVKDYYAASDIFVYSSKSETQGMIITEAMYMGLPVVAVNASGVSSLVRNGKTGFLVPENSKDFSKKVQKLVEDENLRWMFSKNSKELARTEYTAKASGEKMEKVYKRLLKK